jgi:hypothetical protein
MNLDELSETETRLLLKLQIAEEEWFLKHCPPSAAEREEMRQGEEQARHRLSLIRQINGIPENE